MEKAFIISNNPAVWRNFPKTRKVEGSLQEVFLAARNLIHRGSKLLNHPMSGNIKLNEAPFKSLILTGREGSVDLPSLRMIETAMEILNERTALEKNWSDRIREDFALVDCTLLKSALDALPQDMILIK
ncbi:MAG: GrdX family protein [Dehalobacterium sp.]|jgi:hypothetical protein